MYWIPVGTLDDTQDMEVTAHLCVSSKASWEKNLESGIQYSEVPGFSELLEAVGAEVENEI